MTHAMRIAAIGMSLFLAACGHIAVYESPAENAPHALLKLKYKYSGIVPGTTVGARFQVRHDAQADDDAFLAAFNQSYGTVANGNTPPEIPMPALRVHPGKKTDINMAVFFYWYTTQVHTIIVNKIPQMQTQQVYHERACTVRISFTPGAGKVYLLDYNSPSVDRDCSGNAYEQVKQAGDQFRLVKVGTSKAL